jgi:hypothetical protein
MDAANPQYLDRRCIVKGPAIAHGSTLASSVRLAEGRCVESFIPPELVPHPNQR